MSEPRPLIEVCEAVGDIGGYQIRPWRAEDASQLAAAWNDPSISAWNPVPPDTSTMFAAKWIRGAAEQTEDNAGIDVVVVDGSSVDVVRGELGLQIDRRQALAEVGFWVADDQRRSGVGRVLLQFAKALGRELEIRGLVALVDPANEAATGLLEAEAWTELPSKGTRRAFGVRVIP